MLLKKKHAKPQGYYPLVLAGCIDTKGVGVHQQPGEQLHQDHAESTLHRSHAVQLCTKLKLPSFGGYAARVCDNGDPAQLRRGR